jgi:hypothetical protein
MKLDYKKITTCLIENDDPNMVSEVASILKESADLTAEETDSMSYLMKLEEFLDDCGIYIFDGWEEAIVLKEPEIEKFWVIFDFILPKGADLEAASHISGKNREAKVYLRKVEDKRIIRIKVLRRILDEIEFRNRLEAEKDAKPVADSPLSSPLGNAAPPGGMPPTGGGGMPPTGGGQF